MRGPVGSILQWFARIAAAFTKLSDIFRERRLLYRISRLKVAVPHRLDELRYDWPVAATSPRFIGFVQMKNVKV